jgi:hypothetical protein
MLDMRVELFYDLYTKPVETFILNLNICSMDRVDHNMIKYLYKAIRPSVIIGSFSRTS